jgi:hypothetical protein
VKKARKNVGRDFTVSSLRSLEDEPVSSSIQEISIAMSIMYAGASSLRYAFEN